MFSKKFLMIILYVTFFSTLIATEKIKELQVLAINNPPFISINEGDVEGFSSEIWKKICVTIYLVIIIKTLFLLKIVEIQLIFYMG